MKIYSRRIKLFASFVAMTALAISCKKGLDYTNTGAISPDNVWKDPVQINGFLNDIYGNSMPGWAFDGNSSDEATNGLKQLGNYQRGIVAVDQTTSALNYTTIEKINFFLNNLTTVPTSVLSASQNAQMVGQAKFWRAWWYWGMVQNVGGVPLILKAQNATDSLFVPRNKTSECITQIVKDLDDAIAVLPSTYTGADYGRITKIAAMAVKGKVLLYYASPLFNPTNDAARWQAAYTANKAAVDSATNAGYGLFANYRNVWYTRRNQEVIMSRQYIYPGSSVSFNYIRPEPFTKDATGNNQPVLNLLLAYPKKDGSPMQFDATQLSNPAYNAQFLTDFYKNRDDRFYATIFFGGVPYPTPDVFPGQYAKGDSFWNIFKFNTATSTYSTAIPDIHNGMGGGGSAGVSGFWERKGLDTTLLAAAYAQNAVDFPVIRYAEIYMNYGECANETGKASEALQVLYGIRKRASITPGASNTYGVTATTQSQIRDAYITERQVEFAFENKRLSDLRRLKRYDILNSQVYRHGLYTTIKAGVKIVPSETILTDTTRAKLTANYIDNLDSDPAYKFNLDLNHWFYAIPPAQITQSKNVLAQNNEWGGAFDPLQ